MLWLTTSIFAYFLNAIAALIDKFLLNKAIPYPAVYAFYVSILGLAAFIFAPFGFQFPPLIILSASLVAGAIFVFGLWIFYYLLKRGEASRVVPLTGGFTPLFILALAWLLVGERLSVHQLFAFLFILAGSWLIIWERSKNKEKKPFPWPTFFLSLAVAFLFGLSLVLGKFVYNHFSFTSGLIWRGVGGFLGGIIIFLIPQNRKQITKEIKNPKGKSSFILLFGQSCAAISFVLINYAFSLGSVTLVNALTGTQYVFLFLMTIILSKKFPQILKEEITSSVILQKVLSLILIGLGFAFLFF